MEAFPVRTAILAIKGFQTHMLCGWCISVVKLGCRKETLSSNSIRRVNWTDIPILMDCGRLSFAASILNDVQACKWFMSSGKMLKSQGHEVF